MMLVKSVFLKTMLFFLLSLAMRVSATSQPAPAPDQPAGGFQISGILVDSVTEQPVAHARVAVAPMAKRDDLTTLITGQDGLFSFGNLKPGKYTLIAQARGYLTQSFDQHDTFATSVVTGADLDTSHLVFRLPPAGSIAGMVTDEAGEPVRDTQVTLYFNGITAGSDITRLQDKTMTDDQGAFHFGHLVSGHYFVAVIARPWYARYPLSSGVSDLGASLLDVAYPITFSGGTTDAAMAMPVVLAPGDKAMANISLQPMRALRMRVRPEYLGFGRQTHVFLESILPDGTLLPVNPQLNSLRNGQQEVVGIPAGHYILSSRATGGNTPSEPISAREIDLNAYGETQSTAYVPVAAKLQFDSGARPSQAYLQLLNKKTRVVTSQRISDTGDVLFKAGVPPGSYEVSITNAPGSYLKSISPAGAGVTGRTLEVRSGGTVNLTISVASGQGQITGRALREKRGFAGAMIVLVPSDPAHNQVLFRREQSDTDGSFTLGDVVPGAYTLLALEKGWELAWTDPDVLKNYLGRGVSVQVQPNGKYEVKVDVQ
jgi:Carboxypeptidase regulatory-like domain